MKNNNYTCTFLFDQSQEVVFNAICNVRGWWSRALIGNSEQLNDEFEYRHGDLHYSKHKLIEVVPSNKVVWLTLDSKITFVEKQNEWNGTKIIFDIAVENGKTKLMITHEGLTPEIECFENCSMGWNHYLQNSLLPLIITGKGNPD